MAEILRIEHENEVLTQKLADAMAELEVWKRTATEYAGVVKEMRRDMDGMSQLIERMRKEKSELLKF